MDNLQTVLARIRQHLLAVILVENGLVLASYWYARHLLGPNDIVALMAASVLAVAMGIFIAFASSNYVSKPLAAVWAIMMRLHDGQVTDLNSKEIQKLGLGRELVVTIASQVYQLNNMATKAANQPAPIAGGIQHNFIANNLPLPLLVLDETETIQFANQAAAEYLGIPINDLMGKNVYMILDMSFPSEDTFDKWLKHAKDSKATAVQSWERVRLNVRDTHPTRLFDLAVYYNQANTQKVSTMLILFDHTKQYSQDDQAVSFIALSVHELRTPLTLLRGYVEVFQEELRDKVTPDLADFMDKMEASAQQLTAFVNNILNVARVDDDQLELHLAQENWETVLNAAVEGIDLRAHVRGINIECIVQPNLPPVGIDRLSITEVINNLIDNAIKYSGTSNVIKVNSFLNQDGFVETTVQDFGVGIDSSILPNLFSKFYRDHRNRAQIGGTGLGLYLSKAIISAHSGHLWVKSKIGDGSVFGFTVSPYAKLAENIKQNGPDDMVRAAHGWIKNHSLYRR